MSNLLSDPERVARTIKSQIGIDTWLAVSARETFYTSHANGDVTLTFRFGSRYGLPQYCEITYVTASDDYEIYAYRVHRNGSKRAIKLGLNDEAHLTGIYADSLGWLIRDINQEAELS